MQRHTRRDYRLVEMQMGPMIDIVFLLLVFFMVTAKPVKQESDVSMALPGIAELDQPLDIPDETRILIQPTGQVVLNELPLDSPDDRDMPALLKTLLRFRQSAEANKVKPLVTVDADNAAAHQRVVDVLNTCARAGITGVTFATDSSESE